ncbi:MAG TPA: 50S ribosomal protein P1 [Candidatus Nanoarchaeia archaeon]|nr:50S ribosomal protein P1 [Candidatus Nanoarchaeia archaeon]
MEYVYASMLLHKAGKKIEPEAVKKVLEAAGITPDEARIKALVAALENVNIDEAVKKAAVAPAAPAPAAAAKESPKSEKKSAEEEKKSEEAASAGLGALFG